MSAYLNIYQVLSTAVLWGMENNHGVTVHLIILNLPITIRVRQFWWDNVTVHGRWSFKGDGGKGALMADTGFHFYHDHLLEFWWAREALNTTTERKSRTTDNGENVMPWLDSRDKRRRDGGRKRNEGQGTPKQKGQGDGWGRGMRRGWLGQREEEYNDTVRSPGLPWWSSGQEFTATAGGTG